jgi:glycosyltransferase involved in cell wall biosynthesis
MSDSGPLVLAIPVFNAAHYVAATLESLNAQGANLRWWLQDGGSTDATVEIARAHARPSDTVVSEPDEGQADAINRAFARMGGSIVGFINGDDVLTPGSAERIVNFFADHPHIDLIYGCVEWMDAQGEITGFHRGKIGSLGELLDVYNVWWGKRQWVQPEVFFRRSLYERVGGFDRQWHLAFDYDFWVRCMLAGARIAHTPAITARFRVHAAQKSSAADRAADEIRSIVQKHLPNAPLGFWTRLKLRAALSYDHYQLGRSTQEGAPRASFPSALLTHPHWLLSPLVRSRAQSSLAKALPFLRRKAK